jgi:hypothetical protein
MEMIKIVCIDNKNQSNLGLTIGKIYDCSLEQWKNGGDLELTTDNGIEFYLWRERFITLAEWREQQIDKILEDDI